MKVLIFHQYYDTPSKWGSTRQYYFTEELIAAGHSVVIITGSKIRAEFNKSNKKKILFTVQDDKNKKIISIADAYVQRSGFIKRIISFFTFSIFSFFIALGCKEMDVVFASSTPLTIALPALLISKLKKIPMLFEVRDIWPEAPVSLGYLKNRIVIKLAENLEKAAYSNSKIIITLSSRMQKKIQNKTKTEVVFLPNGVDDGFFKTDRTRKSEKIRIIYAGSCGKNNAIDILFKTFDKLIKDPDIKDKIEIKIIGDGPALDVFRTQYKNEIYFSGRISKSEVIEELKNADIAMYPQRRIAENDIKKDALPNKLFDYIGSGLAIVASIVSDGEAAELIIENQCGLVSEPEDINEMYKNTVELVKNNELRMKLSENAFNLAQNYKRSAHAEKFRKILETTVRYEKA